MVVGGWFKPASSCEARELYRFRMGDQAAQGEASRVASSGNDCVRIGQAAAGAETKGQQAGGVRTRAKLRGFQ